MNKLRDLSWKERGRASQLANALYPHLASPHVQKQLLDRAAQDGEQGSAGLERRIRSGQQQYGIEPTKPRTDNLSRVPGLVPSIANRSK